MNNEFIRSRSVYVAYLAILVAFVAVFQVFGGYIRIGGTALSLVLVPIVLGGIILGPLGGGILGTVFSLIVLIMGLVGADYFTGTLLSAAPFGTVLTVIIKGVAAGVIPALIYKAIAKKNKIAAVFVASALAPIINTTVFIVGMLCMSGVLQATFVPEGQTVIYFLIIGCAGINFIVELAINLVLTPAIMKAVSVVGKRR